jgi:hypothetical protein
MKWILTAARERDRSKSMFAAKLAELVSILSIFLSAEKFLYENFGQNIVLKHQQKLLLTYIDMIL